MRARTNLVLDVVIAAAFLVAANPPVAGLAVHEWLGLAFTAALIAHLVLHWEWIVAATKRVFARDGRGRRLNYVVDAILFVATTVVCLSGLMISRHVLPAVGLPSPAESAWREIHSLAADVSIAAMGVHLGLHWSWIALNLPRLLMVNRRTAARQRAWERQSPSAGASCPSDAS